MFDYYFRSGKVRFFVLGSPAGLSHRRFRATTTVRYRKKYHLPLLFSNYLKNSRGECLTGTLSKTPNYFLASLTLFVYMCLFVLMHQCYYKYFVNLQNDRAKGECSFFPYTHLHTPIHRQTNRLLILNNRIQEYIQLTI